MKGRGMILCAVLAFSGVFAEEVQSLRVGVFDQALVFEKTEEGRRMRGELSALRDRKQAEIEEKENELQALRNRYTSEEYNLTPERRAELERQIDQALRDYQRLNEDATREVKSQLNEYQERFQRETYKVVAALGKELGFTLILEKSLLFYHAASVDITDRVIEKFNAMHRNPS